MRIAACTVVAILAIPLDGWAQPPHDRSQREFGLSHRPDPRGHHRFGGGDGSLGGASLSGSTGWTPGPIGTPPPTVPGPAPTIPGVHLDIPALPGIPSLRERARDTIPDCIAR